jgi:hypothetical protein
MMTTNAPSLLLSERPGAFPAIEGGMLRSADARSQQFAIAAGIIPATLAQTIARAR